MLVADPDAAGTGLILFPQADSLPAVLAGPLPASGLAPEDAAGLLAAVRPCHLLPEHGAGWFGRPGRAPAGTGHSRSGGRAGLVAAVPSSQL